MSVRRRVRAFLGQLLLLAVLGGMTAFLVSGPARLANGRTDDGLRGDIRALAYVNRDLTYVGRHPGGEASTAGGESRLAAIREQLPAPLRGLVGDAWYAAETSQMPMVRSGGNTGSCPDLATVRYQPGTVALSTIVDGRAAKSGRTAEVIVGEDAARELGIRTGDSWDLAGRWGGIRVRVAGLFRPRDPADPIWDDQKLAKAACPDPKDDLRHQAVLLTDQQGARLAGAGLADLTDRWRYRLDERRITADRVGELTKVLALARRTPPEMTSLQGELDSTLAEFNRQTRAVQSLLAVVQAGLLATAVGLILLAARLMSDRRRAEFALLRARGAAVPAVAGRTVLETLVVAPAAVALGWLAGTLVPGRADAAEPALVALVALVTVLAAPLYAALDARHPSFSGRRPDVAATRPSPRRLTAEGFLVLLAAGGIYLVRLRGLDPGAGVDPYLIAAPLLLALAASIVALRLVPFPLRGAGRIAARTRGAIGFLGLSGAGRAPMHSGPLAVLVVAVATGMFTGAVAGAIGAARDRAADLTVPADAVVSGLFFTPQTAQHIAEMPHVGRATPMLLASAVVIHGAADAATTAQGQALVVDASAAGLDLPAALTGARPGGDAVPALVSPGLAERIGTGGTVDVQGRSYRFTVAAVEATAPGIGSGGRDFLVLPQQAMPVPDFQPIQPNRILVDGAGFDIDQIRRTADAGQREQFKKATGRDVVDSQLSVPATVTTWDAYRAALEARGVDGALSFTFTAGLVGSAVLALAAVALAVLTGAPARGRTLSRLRTMGLSPGQGRRLLVFELIPLVAVAVLAGGLAGFALPPLIGPALNLNGFTAGVPADTSLDPWLAGGVLGIAVLAVIGALAVENVANRRLRLGTVLRLGEEQP